MAEKLKQTDLCATHWQGVGVGARESVAVCESVHKGDAWVDPYMPSASVVSSYMGALWNSSLSGKLDKMKYSSICGTRWRGT